MSKYHLTFEPTFCKAEDGKTLSYTGTVTMRIPSWEERLEFLEGFGATPDDAAAYLNDKANRMSIMKHLATIAPEFFVRADIVRVDDNATFETWADIQHESDLAHPVIPELSWWLIGKHRISGPSAPS